MARADTDIEISRGRLALLLDGLIDPTPGDMPGLLNEIDRLGGVEEHTDMEIAHWKARALVAEQRLEELEPGKADDAAQAVSG